MSDLSSMPLTFHQKMGCGLYSALVLAASMFLLLFRIFGQCGAWAPKGCVQPSALVLFGLFPGGPIILVALGFALLKFMKRDRQ